MTTPNSSPPPEAPTGAVARPHFIWRFGYRGCAIFLGLIFFTGGMSKLMPFPGVMGVAPAVGQTMIWDSATDILGLSGVTLRITVDDGALTVVQDRQALVQSNLEVGTVALLEVLQLRLESLGTLHLHRQGARLLPLVSEEIHGDPDSHDAHPRIQSPLPRVG